MLAPVKKAPLKKDPMREALDAAAQTTAIKQQAIFEDPFKKGGHIISAKQMDVDRFATYNSKTYGKLGFDPFKDNNKIYNDEANVHWSEDLGRATRGMFKLAGVGFLDTFGFGIAAEKDNWKNFDQVMRDYSSTRGGYTQFWSNTLLSTGYTVGILSAIAAEEAVLALTTGGLGNVSTAGLVGFQAGKAFEKLGHLSGGTRVLDNVTALSHADEAAKFFSLKGVGQNSLKLAKKLNPVSESLDFLKNVNKLDNLNAWQKLAVGSGSVARDARKLYMTHSESKLEAELAKNDFVNKKILQAKYDSPDGMLSKKDVDDISFSGQNVYTDTYKNNLALIYATNAITFDNMFKSMRYTNKMFSIPGKLATSLGKDGVVVKAVKNFSGKRALATSKKAISDFSLKNTAKSAIRYTTKNYKTAGANLIKKGLSNSMEGIQELGQDVISNSVQSYYGRNHAGKQVRGGFLNYLYEDIGTALKGTANAEGLSTFGSGFFMGTLASPFGGGISYLQKQLVGGGAKAKMQYIFDRENYVKQQKTKYKESLAKAKALTLSFNNQLGSFLEYTYNPLVTQAEFQEVILGAAKENDKKKLEDGKHDSLQHGVKTMLKNNSETMFTDFLSDMVNNYTAEQMNQAMGRTDITEQNKAEYKAKLQTKIETVKSLRKQYDKIEDSIVSPITQNDIDRLDINDPVQAKQKLELIIQKKAWDNLKEELLFNNGKIVNKAERMKALEKQLIKETNLSSTEVQALISKESLANEIKILQTKTEANKNLNLTGAELKQANLAADKLESLLKYQKALTTVESVQNAEDQSMDDFDNAYSDLFEAYHEFRTLDPMHGFMEPEEVKRAISRKSFDNIVDYLDLSDESEALQGIVNTLLDPTSAKMWIDKNAEMMADLDKNKEKHIANQLYAFEEKAASSEMLTELQEVGIFFDLNELDDLVGKGIMPSEIYNIDTNKAASKEEYQIAQDIISVFYTKLKGKSITQDKSKGTKRSLRYEGDNRSVKKLLRDYGITLGKEIDLLEPVQLERLLKKLKKSEFLTQIDKELLDKVSDSTPVIMFVDNGEFPISINEDGVFVIDVRYAGSDYKNVSINFETLVLSALTQAKLNDNLEDNPNLKAEVDNLMQQAKDAFSKKYPNLDVATISMLNDVSEFLSESLNNTAFQSFLGGITDTVSGNKELLWKSLMAKIMKAFNKTFEKSILQRAVSLSNMAFDETITDNIDEKVDETAVAPEEELEPVSSVEKNGFKLIEASPGVWQVVDKSGKVTLFNTKAEAEEDFNEKTGPVKQTVKQTIKEKVKRTIQLGNTEFLENASDSPELFSDFLHPEIVSNDNLAVAEWTQKLVDLGQALDDARITKWVYGNIRAQVDGRLMIDVTAEIPVFVKKALKNKKANPKVTQLQKEIEDLDAKIQQLSAQRKTAQPAQLNIEDKIILAGLNGGFQAVSYTAFDVRSDNEISKKTSKKESFATTTIRKGKKYIVVGLMLKQDVGAITSGRDGYTFAIIEDTGNLPSNIVDTLIQKAVTNISDIYPNIKNSTLEDFKEINIDADLISTQSVKLLKDQTFEVHVGGIERGYTEAKESEGKGVGDIRGVVQAASGNTGQLITKGAINGPTQNDNFFVFWTKVDNQGKPLSEFTPDGTGGRDGYVSLSVKVSDNPTQAEIDDVKKATIAKWNQVRAGITGGKFVLSKINANPTVVLSKGSKADLKLNVESTTKNGMDRIISDDSSIKMDNESEELSKLKRYGKTNYYINNGVLGVIIEGKDMFGRGGGRTVVNVKVPEGFNETVFEKLAADIKYPGSTTVAETERVLAEIKDAIQKSIGQSGQDTTKIDEEIEVALKERNALQDQLNIEEPDIIEEGEETVQQGTKKVKFLMYKSTGTGSTAASAGEWVPLLAIGTQPGGREWFVKALYKGEDPKFNKYGSAVFADVDRDLKTQEANLFSGIKRTEEIEEDVEREIDVEIEVPAEESQTIEDVADSNEAQLKTEINQKRALLRVINQQISSTKKVQLRKRMKLDAQKTKLLFDLKDLQAEYDAKYGDKKVVVSGETAETDISDEEEVDIENKVSITESSKFEQLPVSLQEKLIDQYRRIINSSSVGAIKNKYKTEIKELEALNLSMSQALDEDTDAIDEKFGNILNGIQNEIGNRFTVRLNEQGKIEISVTKSNEELSDEDILAIEDKMQNDVSFTKIIIAFNLANESIEPIVEPEPEVTVELTEAQEVMQNALEIERGKQLKQDRLDKDKEDARARRRLRRTNIVPINAMERDQVGELLQKVLKDDFDILTKADLTYLIDNLLNDSKTFRFKIPDVIAFVSKKKTQLASDAQMQQVNETFADELAGVSPEKREALAKDYQKDIFEELSQNSTVYNYGILSKYVKSKEPIKVAYNKKKFSFTLTPTELKALALYNKDLFKTPLKTKEDEESFLISIHKIMQNVKYYASDSKKNLKFKGTPQEIEDQAVKLFFNLMKQGVLLPSVVRAVNYALYNSKVKLTIARSNALSGSIYTLEAREGLAKRNQPKNKLAQDKEIIADFVYDSGLSVTNELWQEALVANWFSNSKNRVHPDFIRKNITRGATEVEYYKSFISPTSKFKTADGLGDIISGDFGEKIQEEDVALQNAVNAIFENYSSISEMITGVAEKIKEIQNFDAGQYESDNDFENFIGTEGAEEAFANLEGYNNSLEFKIITGQLDLATTDYASLTPSQQLLYNQVEADNLYDGANAELANDAANQEIEIPEDSSTEELEEIIEKEKLKQTAIDVTEANLMEELNVIGDRFYMQPAIIAKIEAIENDKDLKLFIAAYKIVNKEEPIFTEAQKIVLNDRLNNRLNSGSFNQMSVLINDVHNSPLMIQSFDTLNKTVDLVDFTTGEIFTISIAQFSTAQEVFEGGEEYTKLNLDTVVNDQEIAYIKDAYQDIFNNFTTSTSEFEKLESADLNSKVLEQLKKCK
jgi:hypothetical protein